MPSCRHHLHTFKFAHRSVRHALAPVYVGKTRPATSVNGSAPLTILSSGPRVLFGCFHRRFTRIAGPPVSPVHRRLIVSLARCVKTMKAGVLLPDRSRYGVMHLPRPVLGGARLSVLYGVHCGKFGAIGLPVLFSTTEKTRNLHRTLGRLYGGTRTTISRKMGCVVLSSHRVSTTRTTVPSLLTMDTMRRRLVSMRGEMRATLIMRDKRVQRIVRTTLLLKCKTDTVGPCVMFTVLSSVIGGNSIRLGCRATRGGCVGTIYGKLCGMVDGVNVDAVHSCHKTGVFRTINLNDRILSACFNAPSSSVKNIKLRDVTGSCRTFRSTNFTGRISSLLPCVNRFSCHGSNRGRT